jgi:hypothetical protein
MQTLVWFIYDWALYKLAVFTEIDVLYSHHFQRSFRYIWYDWQFVVGY